MSDLLSKALQDKGVTGEDLANAIAEAKEYPKRPPIQIIEGDVMYANADLIVHQVNCFGKMNSGVAKTIRNWYPEVFTVYYDYVEGYKYRLNKNNEKVVDNNQLKMLLGQIQIVEVEADPRNHLTKGIVNIFSQYTYGSKKVHTLPNMLRGGLQTLREEMEMFYPEYESIAFPYLIGCGLGGGDIEAIDAIIREVFHESDIDIKYYKHN